MSGERSKGRNAISLAVSAAAHLIFLGMVINQTPPDYELPTPPLTAEPEQPAMQVEIVKLPPPVKTEAPPAENTPPQPTPWPKPQQLKVLPPLPQTPATPLAEPPLPQPTPSLATPANPTPPLPRTPAPTPRPSAVLSRSKPIQAAGPAKATPLVKHNPLGALNIHMPALAPPAGVPTLPMAASPGSAKTTGAAGGRAGARPPPARPVNGGSD